MSVGPAPIRPSLVFRAASSLATGGSRLLPDNAPEDQLRRLPFRDVRLQDPFQTEVAEALATLSLGLEEAPLTDDGQEIVYHRIYSRVGLVALVYLDKEYVESDDHKIQIQLLGRLVQRAENRGIHLFSNAGEASRHKDTFRYWRRSLAVAEPWPNEMITEFRSAQFERRIDLLTDWLDLEKEPPSLPVLLKGDSERLEETLANFAAESADPKEYFKNKVHALPMKRTYQNELAGVWSGNTNMDAQKFIEWIFAHPEVEPTRAGHSLLGALAVALSRDVGQGDAEFLVGVIRRYGLIRAPAILEKLKQDFGV